MKIHAIYNHSVNKFCKKVKQNGYQNWKSKNRLLATNGGFLIFNFWCYFLDFVEKYCYRSGKNFTNLRLLKFSEQTVKKQASNNGFHQAVLAKIKPPPTENWIFCAKTTWRKSLYLSYFWSDSFGNLSKWKFMQFTTTL